MFATNNKFKRLMVMLFTLPALSSGVLAQEKSDPLSGLKLPGLKRFAPSTAEEALASSVQGEITLQARLTEEAEDLDRGVVWRVFKPDFEEGGKLPMVATAEGGTHSFRLPTGSYLVHAAFGRAGATKRITIAEEPKSETLVLDAGGLKLDAILSGGVKIPPIKLRFSIYHSEEDEAGERALIVPNVRPNSIIRLNAGIYHVVSNYGNVNAVIRSDIRVEAGKLTEAQVEHRAAQLTLKLVRESGGEAIADTSWSVLTDSGDIVRESVGAFSSMVLSEGTYTIIATNRGRVFQREFVVKAGRNQDVEVLAVAE